MIQILEETQHNEQIWIRMRNHKRFDAGKFIEDIKSSIASGQYENIYNTQNAQQAYDLFLKLYRSVQNKNVPYCLVHLRKNTLPYISDELKNIIKLKQRAYKDYVDLLKRSMPIGLNNTFDQELKDQRQRYVSARNAVNSQLENAKKEYYSNAFKDIEPSGKKAWNLLNQLRNKDNNKINMNCIDIEGSKSISDIANGMGEFYQQKIANIKTNITSSNMDPHVLTKASLQNKSVPEFNINTPTYRMVKNSAKKIKSNFAEGEDGIIAKYFKLAFDFLLPYIHFIICMSIENQQVPNKWER